MRVNFFSFKIRSAYYKTSFRGLKFKPVLFAPSGQRPRLTKLVLTKCFFFVKLSLIRCINFSVFPRTGSNPADINRFRSHTGNVLQFSFLGLFQPLFYQIIHWFTKDAKRGSQETECLLEALINTICSSKVYKLFHTSRAKLFPRVGCVLNLSMLKSI